MPSFKTVFGSFLKTEDLQDRRVSVTITEVNLTTIKGQEGQPDEKKLAAHFAGKDKALVLNRTRCEQLEAIFGTDDYEQWAGPVVLVPGLTKFGGKSVGCINIEARGAAAPKPAPKPVAVAEPEELDSDAIPFAWVLPLLVPALSLLGVVA